MVYKWEVYVLKDFKSFWELTPSNIWDQNIPIYILYSRTWTALQPALTWRWAHSSSFQSSELKRQTAVYGQDPASSPIRISIQTLWIGRPRSFPQVLPHSGCGSRHRWVNQGSRSRRKDLGLEGSLTHWSGVDAGREPASAGKKSSLPGRTHAAGNTELCKKWAFLAGTWHWGGLEGPRAGAGAWSTPVGRALMPSDPGIRPCFLG